MSLCARMLTRAIAPIMNVVGRKYRVGRVRSRPSTRLRPTACSSQPTADQRLRTFFFHRLNRTLLVRFQPATKGGKFIGEIKAGRVPGRQRSPTMGAGAELRNVSVFLDAYMGHCVKPADLRSIAAVRSRVGVLKEHLGELSPDGARGSGRHQPVQDRLGVCRGRGDRNGAPRPRNAAGRDELGYAQTSPLFNRSPFHRFGVRLNKKAETARDRRLTRDEERRLLDTALQKMNTP